MSGALNDRLKAWLYGHGPLPESNAPGTPETPDEWRREWRVLVEALRGHPNRWPFNRWPILDLADPEPPDEFVRTYLTGWYYASTYIAGVKRENAAMLADLPGMYGRLVAPHEHPQVLRVLDKLDEIVAGERARRVRARVEAAEAPARRGRPKGTRSVPKQRIIEKFRSLRSTYGRDPTQQELADNLEPRVEVRTLQEHLTDYRLPWPIE